MGRELGIETAREREEKWKEIKRQIERYAKRQERQVERREG